MRSITAAVLAFAGALLIFGCAGTGSSSDGGAFEALSCSSPESTPQSLHEKAERFDLLAQSLHIPAGQDQLYSVILQDDLVTLDRVDMSDNVGTWTALYTASQAFRWAATGEPRALDNLRRAVLGERDMMRITGVPGLFTRVMVNPELPGFPSAAQLDAWYPDCDLSQRHCKRFNLVREGEFAGWWFKNDVSKDEYAAHMFSMAAAWELCDDDQVRAAVSEVVTAVADHLMEHNLKITDIDGQVTTYGYMNALSFNDFPGFNALLSLSWLQLAAVVGGEPYRAYYRDCLLQQGGREVCIHDPDEDPRPYTEYLDTASVGLNLGCMTNWNNHNMAQLAAWSLVRLESDPELQAIYRRALRQSLWDAEAERPMRVQKKTLYTFFYLVNRDPSDPWPAQAAEEALCVMKTFPAGKEHYAVDTFSSYSQTCLDRSDEPLTDVVIPIPERSMDNFVWINNPYKLESEPAEPRWVESPEDYLLAYWLGRYFGFIRAEM